MVNMPYFVGFVLSILIFILIISGESSMWYHTEISLHPHYVLTLDEYISYSEYDYAGMSIRCNHFQGGNKEECFVGGDFHSMYALILVCCIFGSILSFVSIFFFMILAFNFFGNVSFLSWRNRLRIPLAVICILLTMLVTLAWLLLLWHPAAIADAYHTKCKKEFHDSVFCKMSGSANGATWGPWAGFGLFIVIMIFCIPLDVLAIVAFIRPLERDQNKYGDITTYS